MTPKVSDEHRQRRHRQIIDAAVACFERRGLHATTVDDIIAEAGLSAGAIYRYFDGKDAIIEAIAADRHAHERLLLADALGADDLRSGVHGFLDRYFDWLADPDEQRRRRITVYLWAEALHDPRLAAVVRAGLEPLDPVVNAIAAAFGAARAARPSRASTGSVEPPGVPAPRIDPEAFARILLALIQGVVLQMSWDPSVDLGSYRAAALAAIDTLIDAAGASPVASSPSD